MLRLVGRASGETVRNDVPLVVDAIDNLVAERKERGVISSYHDPALLPLPAVPNRCGVDAAEERVDGCPTTVSLYALARDDGDVGIVAEQRNCFLEVLRREA